VKRNGVPLSNDTGHNGGCQSNTLIIVRKQLILVIILHGFGGGGYTDKEDSTVAKLRVRPTVSAITRFNPTANAPNWDP